MTPRRTALLLALAALVAPRLVRAQNSIYGLIGVGFPGEPLSVRARALGGGIGAFDPTSALNPAAVARFERLTAEATIGTTLRHYTAGDSSVTGLRETRFPLGLFGGRLGGARLSFALSFSTYAERSYDVQASGTQVLRGDTVEITDRIASDGAITDLRGALGVRPWRFLMVGGAVHVIGGSSRLKVARSFSDTRYATYGEQSEVSFSGTGFTGGVLVLPTAAIELGVSVRVDGQLGSRVADRSLAPVHLPVTLNGALRLSPARRVMWASSVTRRSWSRAQPDFTPPTQAFDTWEIGSGIELGQGGRGFPIRLGARYRQLPFSNVTTRPSEVVLGGGTGLLMAGGRATLDLAVEHLKRSGGGAVEQGWHIALGLTVIP